MLKSKTMSLSPTERHWLPWLGSNGKLALGWSCWLNRGNYATVEKVFDGIAATRVRLLTGWAEAQWEQLRALADELAASWPRLPEGALDQYRAQGRDCSELFVVDSGGEVLASTWRAQVGNCIVGEALQRGLQAPFLHGPYLDPLTERIGPSTSKFHDAVTLMFYQPIVRDGRSVGCLCSRVPNDVVGDLIQREAGHIYQDSGDNYLFMVESRFDRRIQPGTALSRSRFEDSAFTLGDNLKQGVRTRWGTVRVQRHTELELRFTDPATGELHPGVRETMRNGSNLFVTYPGYSDYRHIPVIGKGVTFALPGSPDRWGMMCEGDLEEVYRGRSLSHKLMWRYLLIAATALGAPALLSRWSDLSSAAISAVGAGTLLLGALLLRQLYRRDIGGRLREMTDVLRVIAEGGGNLRQRLDPQRLGNDEIGALGRWTNSFIDSLDGTVAQVIDVSGEVRATRTRLVEANHRFGQSAGTVLQSIGGLLDRMSEQLDEIQRVSTTVEEMRGGMDAVLERTRGQFRMVREQTQGIRDSIGSSVQTIRTLNQRADEIGNVVELIGAIADQTNLLALNAAIEAARAGDQGRGFAVVADEVRNLAGRTTSATAQIRQIIDGIQSNARDAVSTMESGVQNVEEGLQRAENAAADNSGIDGLVTRMLGELERIAATGSDHLQSAQNVATITGELAGSLQQLKGSTNSVNNSANRLEKLVGQFQVTQQR